MIKKFFLYLYKQVWKTDDPKVVELVSKVLQPNV